MESCDDKVMHGWYSVTQKNYIQKDIYYYNMNDEVVQVTVVANSMDHGCRYDDMVYMGRLKKFFKTIKYK